MGLGSLPLSLSLSLYIEAALFVDSFFTSSLTQRTNKGTNKAATQLRRDKKSLLLLGAGVLFIHGLLRLCHQSPQAIKVIG